MAMTHPTEMQRIRHIATSWDGVRVAVVAFERRVAVWNLVTGEKISEFDTVLDFGGERLAITDDGMRVVAGAYIRHGIACYDTSSGNETWTRRDLKKVQHISVSSDHVYCGFDRTACHVLDLLTGQDVGAIRGASRVDVSPYGGCLFVEKKSGPAEVLGREDILVARIERTTFAFLSVAFSSSHLLTSESGGPVRCFSLRDGQELWRHAERSGTHAIRVGYNADSGLFQAIVWPFVKGGASRLVQFDPECGDVTATVGIPDSPEYGFCIHGTRLLTWDRSLVDTADGQVVCKFPFSDTRDQGDR